MSPLISVACSVAAALFGAGCSEEVTVDSGSVPVDSDAVEVLPSAWVYEDEAQADGALASGVLEAALAQALTRAPTYDPLVFMDVYGHQLAYATGGCPTFDPSRAGQIYWEGDCTSDHDAVFHGWGLSRWDHGAPDGAGGTCGDLAFYFGFGRIVDPEGAPFEGWGTLSYTDCVSSEGVRSVVASLVGELSAVAATSTWMADAVPMELAWGSSSGVDGVELQLDGGFSGLEGDVYAVRFEDLRFGSADACVIEPDGVVHLWDRAGAAYEVTFDGATTCDGCGAAWSGAREVGAVCGDFAGFYTWRDRPWW